MIGVNPERAVERCERLAKLGSPPPWWRVWELRRWLSAYRSIMAMDISQFAEVLRDAYPPAVIAEMAQRDAPWIARAKKFAEYATRKS